jgi:hypothetical protein
VQGTIDTYNRLMQAMNDKVYSKQQSYSQVPGATGGPSRMKSMEKTTSSKMIAQPMPSNNKVNVTQDYTSNNNGSQSRER